MTSTGTFLDTLGNTWILDPASGEFGALLRRYAEQDPGQVRATLDNREHLATVVIELARLEGPDGDKWSDARLAAGRRLRSWIEDPESDLGRLVFTLSDALGLPHAPPAPRPPIIPDPEPETLVATEPELEPEPIPVTFATAGPAVLRGVTDDPGPASARDPGDLPRLEAVPPEFDGSSSRPGRGKSLIRRLLGI